MTSTTHAFLFCGLVLAPAAGIVAVRRMERGPFIALLVGFLLVAGVAESAWIASVHIFSIEPWERWGRSLGLLRVLPGLGIAVVAIRGWHRVSRWRGWMRAEPTAPAAVGDEPYRRASPPRSNADRRPTRTRVTEATVAIVGIVWIALFGAGVARDRHDDRVVRRACASIHIGDSVPTAREGAERAGRSIRSLTQDHIGDGDSFDSEDTRNERWLWFRRRTSTSDEPVLWIQGADVECEIDHRAGRVTATRLISGER